MIDVHMLRIFADDRGEHSSLSSVIVDEGRLIADTRRQSLASQLSTGETAFINCLDPANVSIMHPRGEMDFAGGAALGAAWLIAKLCGQPAKNMQTRAGTIITWQDNNLTWVRSNLKYMPPWHHLQLKNALGVEEFCPERMAIAGHTMVWAWMNEANGLIRARTFAADWGIPEAQGNGSGSMMLASMLKRSIEIKHGKGAVIFAKPSPDGCADIGGRTVEDVCAT